MKKAIGSFSLFLGTIASAQIGYLWSADELQRTSDLVVIADRCCVGCDTSADQQRFRTASELALSDLQQQVERRVERDNCLQFATHSIDGIIVLGIALAVEHTGHAHEMTAR